MLGAVLLLAALAGAPERETVTVIGFSDYHSHAVPFFSEGRPRQGGIARAVAYLQEARRDPRTLVLSGGDMLNRGAPLWSDVHGCVEWPWLDGLVDAMALGNHDLDYGPQAFEKCRMAVRYPILSANLVGADGKAHLQAEGKPYLVRKVGGVRLGLFALGGPDLEHLVRPENLPAGTRWADPVNTAREVVRALREEEKVSAVVFFGHQGREDDIAMARAVPGIDLILGSHSHLKGALTTIPGTRTALISPFQYLAYASRVHLDFAKGGLAGVRGELVTMDAKRAEDPDVAARVAGLQQAMEAAHPDRFRAFAHLREGRSDADTTSRPSPIGTWATEVLRRAAGAHAFLAVASGIRGGLPAGALTMEDFIGAFPYPNRVVVAEMTGRQVADLVAQSEAQAGSDRYSQQSGLRYVLREGRPVEIQILLDPDRPAAFGPLSPDGVYRIGTSDYQAQVAEGYKDLFAGARRLSRTELDAQALLREALAAGR